MEDNIELIVTSIKELTKKRRLVYINYEPAFALYVAELRKFGIKDGESVRKEAYDSLIDDVLSKRATVRAMALLKNKDYTGKGLEDKLRDGRCRAKRRSYVRKWRRTSSKYSRRKCNTTKWTKNKSGRNSTTTTSNGTSIKANRGAK